MDQREFLRKAQEAEAMADSVQDSRERGRWEEIAKEWRRLAKAAADMRRGKPPSGLWDA
ncbi:MAG TPA: hypothetical protein VFI23_05575 [Rhizomicrobium sp.]|nr:hypothetical protein [Rhizomicrobium sp.]